MDTLLVQYCKKLHFGSNIVDNATSIIAIYWEVYIKGAECEYFYK